MLLPRLRGAAAVLLCTAAGCAPQARDGEPLRSASTSDSAVEWSAPATIPTWSALLGISSHHQLVDLAAGPAGELHALLAADADRDQSFDALYYSRFASRRWTAPEALARGARLVQSPRIAVDQAGHPHVLWYEHWGLAPLRAPTDLVHRFFDGHGWSPSASVYYEPDPGGVKIPNLAVTADCAGGVRVAHASALHGMSSTSWTQAGWSAPTHLDHMGLTAAWSAPACAVPLELVYVASGSGREPGSSVNDVFVQTPDGGGLGVVRSVYRAATRYSHYPLLFVDRRGTRHAMWLEDTDGQLLPEALFHSTSADGAAWTPARDVTPPALRRATMWMMRGAVDAAGGVHVALRSGRGTGPGGGVHVVRLADGAWSAPHLLVPEERMGVGEVVLATAGRMVHAVWRGADGRYYHATWAPPSDRT